MQSTAKIKTIGPFATKSKLQVINYVHNSHYFPQVGIIEQHKFVDIMT